jgi:hypothetical protein
MTIDELPGLFFRGLVIGAYKLDCPADMTVLVKNVRSILGIFGFPKIREFTEHRNHFLSVRFPTQNRISN